MLSLAKDLLRKTQDKDAQEIKPLTVCFWTDFMANPSVMYNLFSDNPRKLQYDPDRVKVMGTKEGMINQINITSMEDLESFYEQIMGVPLLMRVWVEYFKNDYVGAAQPDVYFENDLALLIDTSHPMIRPELEKALDEARKIIQSRRLFCIQINLGTAIDRWLKIFYTSGYNRVCRLRSHRARLYITNFDKKNHHFDCNFLWCLLFFSCWLITAPCYKAYRLYKCKDIVIDINAPIVRRTTLAISGKVIEVMR